MTQRSSEGAHRETEAGVITGGLSERNTNAEVPLCGRISRISQISRGREALGCRARKGEPRGEMVGDGLDRHRKAR